MPERLFTLAMSAWKPVRDLRTGTMKPEIAIGIVTGWSESPAMAREGAIHLVKQQMPERKGFRDHDANVKELPLARLAEWAERNGWAPPEEVARLRAEIARLKKRKGRREVDVEDESEVLA